MTNTQWQNQPLFLYLLTFLVMLIALVMPEISWASASTTAMPWESPLETIQTSLSGPVAGAVALIAMVVAGAVLIFGGEIGEFARRIIMLVLVLGLLVAGNVFVTSLFSGTSALI